MNDRARREPAGVAAESAQHSVPVLIVGAGPVGLTTAILLARQGVQTLVVERHPGTSVHPRARGINIRSMEIFRELGLEGPIWDAGRGLSRSRWMLWVQSLAGDEVRRAPLWSPDTPDGRPGSLSPSGWASCAQDALEPILLAEARRLGVDVRFNATCTSVSQDDRGVSAVLVEQHSPQPQAIRASYLVAADGARSGIRASLGIRTTGSGSLSHQISIYFRADLSRLVDGRYFALCFIEDPAVQGVLLSVNHTDRWVLNVPAGIASGPGEAPPSSERCIDLVRHAVGLPEQPVETLSILPWEARAQVAEQFQAGRIFLAGDAAHVMPPTGAFGMNTGLQDAHNLAWKLASVVRGAAGPSLLATYDAERRPVATLTVENAVRSGRQQFAHATPGERLTGQDTRVTSTIPPPEPVDDLAVMLGYWYTSAAVVGADTTPPTLDALEATGMQLDGRPGTRVPHRWLPSAGETVSTVDRCAGRFTLLTGLGGSPWAAAARATTAMRSIPIEIVQAREVADLVADGALLVRPDGFVGWRSDTSTMPSAQVLGSVLDQILARR